MSKLLSYIGEDKKFDLEEAIGVIRTIDGVTNVKLGDFIGAVFECQYAHDKVIVRISKDCETVTTDGPTKESADFIFQLNKKLSVGIRTIDMNYSFDLDVSEFSSSDDLRGAIEAA
jgi:hypothetical protein